MPRSLSGLNRVLKMAIKKSTVTPKADKEAAQFSALYEKHEKVSCTTEQFNRARCRCGCKFKYGMSAYAMSRGAEEILMISECRRSVWFKIIS